MAKTGIETHEQMTDIFKEICSEVALAVIEKAHMLLWEHINTDTYGISKSAGNVTGINIAYADGEGTPTYEFRNQAWVYKIKKDLVSLIFDGSQMTSPSASNPYVHGDYHNGIDRRDILADLLNVSGYAPQADFTSEMGYREKMREPFWDNFIDELKTKLGKWLYEEFKERGLEIPSLRNAKFG